MFKYSPNGKGMVHGTNGIKSQLKRHYDTNRIYSMVHSPSGKDMVLWKVLYRSGNGKI